MKKILMTLAAVLCCVTTVMAEPVSPSIARQAAARFLQGKGAVLKNEAMQAPRRALGRATDGQEQTEASPYYVFNAKASQGFVIVSGDDCVGDNLVLGYTSQGSFDANAVPANMQGWLDQTASQIAELSCLGLKARAVALHDNVPHLVTTKWNQGNNFFNPQNPYNAFCPVTDGLLCVTGCVATALAQVLYYHRCPQEPLTEGLPAYTMANGRVIEALPPMAFDWDNMVDDYSQPTTEDQQVAVAILMRYCGQLLQMDYTPYVSNSYIFDTDLLVNQFGCDAGVHTVRGDGYTPSGWDELLYNELRDGRPLVFLGHSTGGGHSYVIDGYEVQDGSGYYHVNWGWGGNADGFYKINLLNPDMSGAGGSSTKDGYNYGQGALIGLQPAKSPKDSYHPYLMGLEWDVTNDEQPHAVSAVNPSYRPRTYAVALAGRNADGTADCSRLLGEQTLEVVGFDYGGFNTERHTGREYFQMPENVAEGLTPGSHKLVFVNREAGTDAPWEPVFGPNQYIEITIGDDGQPTDTVFHPVPQLSCTQKNIKTDGLLQRGLRFDVTATISNKSDDDFIGGVECAVFYIDENVLASVEHFSRTGLMVEGGGTTEVPFSITTPRAGNYVLVLTRNGEDITGRSLSNVKKTQGYIGHRTFTISELAFNCENTVYKERDDETGNPACYLDITVANKTPMDYDAAIAAKIYKLDDDGIYRTIVFPGNITALSTDLQVASNARKTVSIQLPIALEPDEYLYQLLISNDFHSRAGDDYFDFTSGLFTVTSTTGIEGIQHETTGNNRYYDLQGRRIDSTKLQKGLYIYNGKKYIK